MHTFSLCADCTIVTKLPWVVTMGINSPLIDLSPKILFKFLDVVQRLHIISPGEGVISHYKPCRPRCVLERSVYQPT